MDSFPAPLKSPSAQGRSTFQIQCASCHGADGEGGAFLTSSTRVPGLTQASTADITRAVRQGGHEGPAFSAAVISDDNLQHLVTYIRETLAQPPNEPASLGPRELEPFSVGVITWGALLLLVCGLALLFSERRA